MFNKQFPYRSLSCGSSEVKKMLGGIRKKCLSVFGKEGLAYPRSTKVKKTFGVSAENVSRCRAGELVEKTRQPTRMFNLVPAKTSGWGLFYFFEIRDSNGFNPLWPRLSVQRHDIFSGERPERETWQNTSYRSKIDYRGEN